MKKSVFLHVDADLYKLKVDWKILGWAWSKMGVATLVSGTKTSSISRRNQQNKLIFCVSIKVKESQKLLQQFLDFGGQEMGVAF